MKLNTYLITEILECEGQELALGHPCDTEVKPGAIVLSVHVWAGIAGHPDIEVIFLVASSRSGHISATELTAKHDL